MLLLLLLFLQHWIANNLFGLAFALNGVEFLQLNRISTGCILLGGLFVYDIFWVSSNDCLCLDASNSLPADKYDSSVPASS
jgi:Signal peptide peptidase